MTGLTGVMMSDAFSPPAPGPCRLLMEEILDLGCSGEVKGMAHYELAGLLLQDPRTSEATLRSHLHTIRLYAEARRQRVRPSARAEEVFQRLHCLLDGPASMAESNLPLASAVPELPESLKYVLP